MAFSGINFRQSATHPSATDNAADTYWHKAGNENFATAVRGAFTGGFGQKAANPWIVGADRSGTGIDARLAGLVSSDTASSVMLVTLPNGAGTYNVRLAVGDRLAARPSMVVSIRNGDGGTILHTRTISTTLDAFGDVNGTVHTAANWPANNTTVQLTFSTAVAAVEFGSNVYLNHLAFELAGAADTTAPTLTGTITISAITQTTATLTWPAGADNVAVAGYDYSSNGGTSYVQLTNVLTVGLTGLTAATTYGIRVRARDAAGNLSTPVLSASLTTASVVAGTLTTPVMKNNTGTVLASETGVVVNVYDATTGALVVRKTAQTSSASGIVTVSDALLVAGTTYAYEVVLSANGRRLPLVAVA